MSGLSAKSNAADKGRVTGTATGTDSFAATPVSSTDAGGPPTGIVEGGGACGGGNAAAACGGNAIPAGRPGIGSPGFQPAGIGGRVLRISAKFTGGAEGCSSLPGGGAGVSAVGAA